MRLKYAIFLLFLVGPSLLHAQQQDVPEPVFTSFPIQPPYILTYHGRDPFKPLDNVDRSPELSITELDYRGVIQVGNSVLALFTWRGNPQVRYTLKYRKLYGGNDKALDGVVGEVTQDDVVLIQGDQKIVFSRK
jgi:hypothetical protein